MRHPKTPVILGVVAVLAVLAVPSHAEPQSGTRSTTQSDEAVPADPQLFDADASGPSDLWGVGVDGAHPGIATHWDGKAWTWVPIARPETTFLTAVGSVAPGDAWAAGHSFHLVHDRLVLEHWNGDAWSVVASPGPTGDLVWPIAMSSTAADDVWLIGFIDRPADGREPFVRHFDGTTWRSAAAPPRVNGKPVWLTSIYTAAPNDVWVVGLSFDRGIREYAAHWNGQHWRRSDTGPFAGVGRAGEVGSVVGRGSTLWAAGETTKRGVPVLLRRDGSGWHQFRIDGGCAGSAAALALPPRGAPWVVCDARRVTVLRRTGSSWTTVGDPGGFQRVAAGRSLEVFSPTDAWVIGTREGVGSARLHWNGERWRAF